MLSMSCRASSRSNTWRSSVTTRSARRCGTTKQMLCSDEACEIIGTLVRVLATAANARAAMPGRRACRALRW